MSSVVRPWANGLLFFLLPAVVLTAQTFTGSITGTITDPAGAMIPAASLSLTNLDTNESRRVGSNESGVYTFAALPPGRYRLGVEHPGFKRFVRNRLRFECSSS
jgi:hypothetical protein